MAIHGEWTRRGERGGGGGRGRGRGGGASRGGGRICGTGERSGRRPRCCWGDRRAGAAPAQACTPGALLRRRPGKPWVVPSHSDSPRGAAHVHDTGGHRCAWRESRPCGGPAPDGPYHGMRTRDCGHGPWPSSRRAPTSTVAYSCAACTAGVVHAAVSCHGPAAPLHRDGTIERWSCSSAASAHAQLDGV